jgi:murein DD-endopeptidase MepM/ murein hydrolase activator NlpD
MLRRSLLILVAASLAAPVAAQAKVPRLIFPVVGPSTYINDFGAPRGSGSHEGVDIMAPKRSLAVAVEAGTVRFWTTSARAGCMLYLHGKSGTSYLYIHLNNDRTLKNDNKGACVQGIAYARGIKNGERVKAGETIAYVGDSGDANGGASHLHFEVHPNGGRATNPYRHLRNARELLFAPAPGSDVFRLAMRGTVVTAAATSATLAVDRLVRYPGGLQVTKVDRKVELAVSPETVVFNPLGALIAGARLAALAAGKPAVVWTETQPTTLQAQLGAPLSLTAEKISLGS